MKMPWKVGGNFEAVCVMCEANWRECAIAITNYLWSEAVRDVVDCLTDFLTREGVIWVLAIVVTSAILLRARYRKNAHSAESSTVSRRMLNRVGYKIQDLELKVNVLTYKMQYGTWPLPHQIYNVNPKKLRKIRVTLSNPGDRNNWIKHMLLSPVEDDTRAPRSNAFDSSVTNLADLFNVKQKCFATPRHARRGKLSTDCSSVETLKSTSDQSVNSRRPGVYARNASGWESDLSKRENFMLQRQSAQPLFLAPVDRCQSSKVFAIPNGRRHPTSSTSVECDPCKEFTDTVRRCRSFLNEVEFNGKSARSDLSRSSGRSETLVSQNARATKPVPLTTNSGKLPRDVREPEERRKVSETRRAEATINDAGTTERTDGVHERGNKNVDEYSGEDGGFPSPKRSVPIAPINRGGSRNAASSRETLYQVRKRLQSLHNVLRTYKDARRESADRVGGIVVDALARPEIVGPESRAVIASSDGGAEGECATADSCEYFKLDRSGESSSSLAEYSSNTSNKTYLCFSDYVSSSRNARSQGYDRRRDAAPRSSRTTTESNDRRGRRSSFRASSGDRRGERDACERNIPSRERNRELDSGPGSNGGDANEGTRDLAEERSEAASGEIRYILSSESFVGKSIRTESGARKRDKFSGDIFDGERYRDNVIIISRSGSRGKLSRGGDRDERPIASLLQEALHFKKALLARLECEKERLRGTNRADESNFPTMVLDIKAEEAPIAGDHRSRGNVNQRYVRVEMKQRRDSLARSSQNASAFARRERAAESGHVPETASEYFSISNLAIRGDDEVDERDRVVPLSALEPPLYEKVISITIPVNVEEEGDENERSSARAKALAEDIQPTRARSRRDTMSENGACPIDDDVVPTGGAAAAADKRPPAMLKLEDLILERVKNIRDYMDAFLRSQNRAISEARRALRCRGESDAFRFASDETSHVIPHNRSAASSSCTGSVERFANSTQRPKLLIDTRSNYKIDNILRCCSDRRLKRNPGMFALIAPVESTFSGVSNARWLSATELEKGRADVSIPLTLRYSRDDDDSRAASETTMISDTSSFAGRERVTLNTNEMSEQMVANTDTNFGKYERQMEISDIEGKFSSHFPLDAPRDRARATTSDERDVTRYNSISRSSSYFTDEAASSVKIDDASLKFTSNVVHASRAKPDVPPIEMNKNSGRVSGERSSDTITITPSKQPPSTIEYSDSMFIDSSLISEKSESRSRDYPIDAIPSRLEENDIVQKLESLASLDSKGTPNADDDPPNDDIKRHESDEMSANDAHLSPRKEPRRQQQQQQQQQQSAKRLHRTYSRIKAKSDVSLVTNATKDFDFNLRPKRSHSFFMPHETLEHIHKLLPDIKLKTGDDALTEDKDELRSATKSVVPTQRVLTKSCIPILKSHLEAARRIKHQAHTRRSPTRGPLTMLWRDKACTRSDATNEEATRESNVVPLANEHLFVEETAFSFAKLNTENALGKEFKTNTTYGGSDVTSKDNTESPSSDNNRNIDPLEIDKDRRLVCGGKSSDTRIMERVEKNAAPKAVAIISIVANDDLRKNYPANTFVLKTGSVCSATELLKQTKGLWAITVEKTEKEVTAKPSITDTCTSMSDLHKLN